MVVCSITLSTIESNIVSNILQHTDSYYKVQELSWKGNPEGKKICMTDKQTNNSWAGVNLYGCTHCAPSPYPLTPPSPPPPSSTPPPPPSCFSRAAVGGYKKFYRKTENKQTHREQIQSLLNLISNVTLGGNSTTTFISRCRMIAAVWKYIIPLFSYPRYS